MARSFLDTATRAALIGLLERAFDLDRFLSFVETLGGSDARDELGEIRGKASAITKYVTRLEGDRAFSPAFFQLWRDRCPLHTGEISRLEGLVLAGEPSRSFDVAIVIALEEEGSALLDLAGDYQPCSDGAMNSYAFSRGTYRCVATVIGPMGETEAARIAERQIGRFEPAAVVTIGISGAMHDDLRVGDVFVPSQVVQYLQNAKATPTEAGGFQVAPGPPSVQPEYNVYTRASGFRLNHPALFRRWRDDSRADLAALVPDDAHRARLVAEELVRAEVELLAAGHEASGPVVSAAVAFARWIRAYDRDMKAIDMETAAVLTVARSQERPRPALAIRGISDYGDERKAKLDAIGKGALRRLAMRNAVRLLWAFLDAGVLPRHQAGGGANA